MCEDNDVHPSLESMLMTKNFHLFRMWMFGPMGAVDPDQVDNDAGNVWRNLYKLEKTFGDDPNPQKMAKFVSQHHNASTLL